MSLLTQHSMEELRTRIEHNPKSVPPVSPKQLIQEGEAVMKKFAMLAVAAAFALVVAPQAQAAGDVAAGQKTATQKCATCHDLTSKKQNKVGPYLWGVAGQPLGKVEGFKYSENHMKAAGEIKTWDDANLDKYLEAPAKVIPGNKMAFAGLKDAAERANVIEFMKTLK